MTVKSNITNAQTSIFRGSELCRLELCPGSGKAQQIIQDSTSKASESGNVIHDALAQVITLETLTSAEAMAAAAQEYALNEKLGDRESFILGWFAAIVQKAVTDRGGASKILREYKTEIPFETPAGTVTVGATPDLIIQTAQGADVFEYKTGYLGQDTADKHLQGQFYVLIAEKLCGPDPIRLHVLAAGNDKGEQHTFADYGDEGKDFVQARIEKALTAAMVPEAPRIVSLKACQYCKAAGTVACKESCTAVNKFEGNIVKMADPVAVFLGLDPSARAATLDRAILVNRILDKIISAAKTSLAQDPDFIPGYKVGEGVTARTIEDARAAFKILSDKAGITPGQFSAIVGVTLGDVKKLYVDHVQGLQKLQGAKPDTKKALEETAVKLLAPVLVEKKRAGSLEKIDE